MFCSSFCQHIKCFIWCSSADKVVYYIISQNVKHVAPPTQKEAHPPAMKTVKFFAVSAAKSNKWPKERTSRQKSEWCKESEFEKQLTLLGTSSVGHAGNVQTCFMFDSCPVCNWAKGGLVLVSVCCVRCVCCVLQFSKNKIAKKQAARKKIQRAFNEKRNWPITSCGPRCCCCCWCCCGKLGKTFCVWQLN